MSNKFDRINKDKIGSLLELKDKCYYHEEDKLNFYFYVNNNNWNFFYCHSFFSLVRDITDLSLFFIINEEISNSIERKPFHDLMEDLILNGHYTNEIVSNGNKIKFKKSKLVHTLSELQDLFKWKYNEILNSQLFDFSNSMFSAFEHWISKIFDNFSDTHKLNLISSRKNKYIKLINDYNNSNEDKKEKLLTKIMKLPGEYISFPDKLNTILKLVNKQNYEQTRNINYDKKLINFLRASRNTIHNSGYHFGKNHSFEFNGKKYELLSGSPMFINHIDKFLLYGELIDIYRNILDSLDDIDFKYYTNIEKDENKINIFNRLINDYKLNSKTEYTYEEIDLIENNFNKIVLDKNRTKEILKFLDRIEIKEELLLDVLSANFNIENS